MPEFLITYDLKETSPPPHKQFLLSAEPKGLLYVFKGSEKLFRLPNTTVWGVFGDAAAARDAFDQAKADAEKKLGKTITVEKRIVTLLDDWLIRSDKSKAPEQKWTKSSNVETCRAHQLNDPYFAY